VTSTPPIFKAPQVKVICFHCGRLVPKSEAFYIAQYDTYLCERHYVDLLNGKAIKLNNWRRSGV
jgi:predicted TIM-barrel fold metal-dependent hydrolase